jgi:tetratricopeptide (TPR) repeat protein
MEVANGFGPEALGYLDFAGQLVLELETNPEFLALRGAAYALSGKYDAAFRDFSRSELDPFSEAKYWRSYSLAGLEDWQQAEDVLPPGVSVIAEYPRNIRDTIGLGLTEVALRAGDTERADSLLEILSADEANMPLAHKSALDYLRGESFRQQGNFDSTKELWGELAKGKDDLYRAKAGLALTVLQLEKGEIKPPEAIDRLEGLRYAWRGDGLEVAVNYRLGKAYIDGGEPIKGLSLLRQAASFAPASDQGKQIASYMTEAFRDLFMTEKLAALSPIDALTIFDEFSELSPAGEDGDKLARRLAERLVEADLLPRAENLLQNQIDTRLKGLEGSTGRRSSRLAPAFGRQSRIKPSKRWAAPNCSSQPIRPPKQPRANAKLRCSARGPIPTRKSLTRRSPRCPCWNKTQTFCACAPTSRGAINAGKTPPTLWRELVSKQDISLTRPLTGRSGRDDSQLGACSLPCRQPLCSCQSARTVRRCDDANG